MEKSRRKRKKRSGGKFVPIALLLLLFAFIIGASVFFRISEIIVEGNTHYSAEEIEQVSELELGDSIFTISLSKTAARICSSFPYIETLNIDRELPEVVYIQVTERYPVAFISD